MKITEPRTMISQTGIVVSKIVARPIMRCDYPPHSP
jgi:hypothetical protein